MPASASTSAPVVLPSIQEMFPDHLLRTLAPATPESTPPTLPRPAPFLGRLPPRNHYLPSPVPPPLTLRFAFDTQPGVPPRSSPSESEPETSTAVLAAQTHTHTRTPTISIAGPGVADSDDAEDIRPQPQPHSSRRFNRPSSRSLRRRIHNNTDIGATQAPATQAPFICPLPACGRGRGRRRRAFDVDSNVRRHNRNHSEPDVSESSSGSADARSTSTASSASSSACASRSPQSSPGPGSHETGIIEITAPPILLLHHYCTAELHYCTAPANYCTGL
ncbi:hypothetical protein MKEN_00748000 [Mycena kentingensis (nom. inval.)]|nr:hypothetical protein MKEN_00748000 [Mycena kentingensis (nom. inval.)]